ncbi:hypothetical protein BO86DRAFT_176990 [Aspergillus japonicus CBS 114.51]|uniref:Methyltransferase domain-containing protein n=1 Tax=Aspergillus japonicus CBS 114.51 TaxID=1448312 RepID=A0A8T8WRY4_ASPJA|nr:hypothetical protein BO86DRAFT_176990 [Aspergillus japonicus CBS 114.51]RAH78615.1 hypothetical protein BO86DRAFT_176990 [Aspergillus japonicus CBS 114.51]
MGPVSALDGYILDRTMYESVRLNEQHLLWKLQTGHVLSPLIPHRPGIRVADLGTGTGIWCLELGQALDVDQAELVGYDVSRDAFSPILNTTTERETEYSGPNVRSGPGGPARSFRRGTPAFVGLCGTR